MVTLHCTQKLLRRLHVGSGGTAAPTTTLGDWTATLIAARPSHLILCVSEVTLLPVVFEAAPLSGLVPRFRCAVAAALKALGVATRRSIARWWRWPPSPSVRPRTGASSAR